MALSGEQWTISYAGNDAVIASVGGGVRQFTVDGEHYIDGYEDDELAFGSAGHVLAPWPGRLDRGEYTFGSKTYRLPWNEPSNQCAIHGLVGWLRWQAADVSDSAVTLECALPAQPGYPFPLVLRTRWSVGPYGLRAAHMVSNVGVEPCPFGLGVHPYLRLPQGTPDTWTLRVPAKQQVVTDERMIPTGETTAAAFGEATTIGDTILDTTYGDLERGADRQARVRVTTQDNSHGVDMWVDESFGWLQLYTGDTLEAERRRRSVAVEPMTCPANAFNSGTGLVTLQPGELWSGTWGIQAHKVAGSGRT